MQARNDKNMGYEYFGALKGYHDGKRDACYRFVWKSIYEKREALITIGIYLKMILGISMSQPFDKILHDK